MPICPSSSSTFHFSLFWTIKQKMNGTCLWICVDVDLIFQSKPLYMIQYSTVVRVLFMFWGIHVVL